MPFRTDRRRRIVVRCALGALFLLAGCAPWRPRPIAPAILDGWRREIAALVVDSVYRRGITAPIAILRQPADTACGPAGLRDSVSACLPLPQRWGVDSLWWASDDPAAAAEARVDLLRRAGRDADLVPLVRDGHVPLEASQRPPDGADVGAWRDFRAATGGSAGAVRLSPVGFSRRGTRAVVFVDWACGPTCGHHLTVALRREADAWRLQDVLLVWSAAGNAPRPAP